MMNPRTLGVARSVALVFAINLGFAFLLSLNDPRGFIHPFLTAQIGGFAIAAAVAWARPWRRERPIVSTIVAVVAGTVAGIVLTVSLKVAFALYGWDFVRTNLSGIYESMMALGLNGLFVSLFFLHYFREQEMKIQAHRFERQMAESELKLLQAQVEPHFLVNTLSNVQFLIETDPPAASRIMAHLIEYLRASIPQIRGRSTTLGQEGRLVNAYLSIMAVRMGRRLRFEVSIPSELEAADFAPLMLLSLVENAIKHGLDPVAEGGEVRVEAHCEPGSGEAGRLVVSVSDTGRGLDAAALQPAQPAGGGLGLANLRERLQALYGARARFSVSPRSPRGTLARIEIDGVDVCKPLPH